MLSDAAKRIMVRAVIIRLDRGEELDDIMESYPKLTDDDRKDIIEEVKKTINRE